MRPRHDAVSSEPDRPGPNVALDLRIEELVVPAAPLLVHARGSRPMMLVMSGVIAAGFAGSWIAGGTPAPPDGAVRLSPRVAADVAATLGDAPVVRADDVVVTITSSSVDVEVRIPRAPVRVRAALVIAEVEVSSVTRHVPRPGPVVLGLPKPAIPFNAQAELRVSVLDDGASVREEILARAPVTVSASTVAGLLSLSLQDTGVWTVVVDAFVPSRALGVEFRLEDRRGATIGAASVVPESGSSWGGLLAGVALVSASIPLDGPPPACELVLEMAWDDPNGLHRLRSLIVAGPTLALYQEDGGPADGP